MDIDNVLMSGSTERFHAVPGITKQSVARHSWGVAVLCQYLYPDCKKRLLLAAMYHDCAEMVTGDIPGTMKWAVSDLKERMDEYEYHIEEEWGIRITLNTTERRQLKICDILEGMRYCIYRYRCGEKEARAVFIRWAKRMVDLFTLHPTELDYFNKLLKEMNYDRQ